VQLDATEKIDAWHGRVTPKTTHYGMRRNVTMDPSGAFTVETTRDVDRPSQLLSAAKANKPTIIAEHACNTPIGRKQPSAAVQNGAMHARAAIALGRPVWHHADVKPNAIEASEPLALIGACEQGLGRDAERASQLQQIERLRRVAHQPSNGRFASGRQQQFGRKRACVTLLGIALQPGTHRRLAVKHGVPDLVSEREPCCAV
jgi:hypothetical protein